MIYLHASIISYPTDRGTSPASLSYPQNLICKQLAWLPYPPGPVSAFIEWKFNSHQRPSRVITGPLWTVLQKELQVKSKQCLFVVTKILPPWIYASFLYQSNLMICLLSTLLQQTQGISIFFPIILSPFLNQFLKYISILELLFCLGFVNYRVIFIWIFNV